MFTHTSAIQQRVYWEDLLNNITGYTYSAKAPRGGQRAAPQKPAKRSWVSHARGAPTAWRAGSARATIFESRPPHQRCG